MAYTKYSLTPSNNTATPPDGAPEGMLPSAVNDTMRDMMAQIRDCGDGIRDGTYTMTAPKITGGTITGVAFTGNTFTSPVIFGGSINNTPIGASTANTGAFTTLSATGVTTVQAGTNSAPAITTSGDTNTGIYFPAADTIGFTEGGVEALRLNSNGQTSTSIAGTASLPSFTRTGDENTGIFFPAADTIAFTEGGVESMRITDVGNVGIGTNSPTANRRLDAVVSANASAGIRVQNSNAGTATSSNTSYSNGSFNHEFGILGTGYTTYGVLNASDAYIYGSSNNISFGADGASAVIKFGTGAGIPERMRIDSSGNVGIGTSSPNIAGVSKAVTLNTTNGTSGAIYEIGVNGTNYAYLFANASNTVLSSVQALPLLFNTGNTERMRITSGGDLLIGTTTNLNAKLGIVGASGVSSINCGDATDTNTYGMVQIVRPANQPDNKYHLAFVRNGNKIAGMGFLDNSDTFAIQNSGDNNTGAGVTLTNAATSWGTTSDERKKDIIGNVENALTKLADWRSVYYKYKTDEETDPQRVGLIAQDVQATLPEAISVEEDELQTLQLRYTEVIPVLVKAIQELHEIVKAQAAEIALLKSK